jgi:hypothetical protein
MVVRDVAVTVPETRTKVVVIWASVLTVTNSCCTHNPQRAHPEGHAARPRTLYILVAKGQRMFVGLQGVQAWECTNLCPQLAQ